MFGLYEASGEEYYPKISTLILLLDFSSTNIFLILLIYQRSTHGPLDVVRSYYLPNALSW